MKPRILVVCCSVLEKELRAIMKNRRADVDLVFPDSMLHMHPERLHREMERILAEHPAQPCLIVYGDCHAHMENMERAPHRSRTQGVNCAELLMGNERYRNLRKEKAFLFLPEWTERWREVFQEELGFSDGALAGEFMRETRKKLVYLDTGIVPVPVETLKEISRFFGMPVETIRPTLDHLANAVEKALKRLDREDFHES